MSTPLDTHLRPLPRVDGPPDDQLWTHQPGVDESSADELDVDITGFDQPGPRQTGLPQTGFDEPPAGAGYAADDEGWSEPTQWTPSGPLERQEAGRTARLPGLDGLRAIAVTAVVVFHLDPSLLPGGFLGVDLFFVISGFLITRLLLADVAATGAIRLGRFYRRRARRLLPAVVALLLVVYLAGTLIWRSELPTLQGSLTSSLGYVTNWWLIFDHQSYFVATGRPPMLQHLWSLAVEEQYYLLWPAVIVGLTAAARRRGFHKPPEFRRLALVGLLLALTSTVVMAVIAIRTDVPYATDSSRVYFGTDTHGMGLLLGSAVAAWTAADPRRRPLSAAVERYIDIAAAAGLVVLLWLFITLDQYTAGLYRGGLLLINILAVGVIAAVARPASRVGHVLDRPLLRALGQRSYAIYLWHWPVVVVTRPGLDVHGPSWLINIARVVLILVLADVSYRYIERPLRAGGGHRVAPRPLSATSRGAIPWLPLLAGASLTVLLLAASPLLRPSGSDSVAPVAVAATPAASSGARSPAAKASTSRRPVTAPTPASKTARHTTPAQPPQPPQPGAVPPLSAFGDSVLLGARDALTRLSPKTNVDAVEGRQAVFVLADIVSAHQRHELSQVVVIHTGNNGVIDPAQLDSTLSELADRRRIVLLTVRVARDWQDRNNGIIERAAGQHANVRLVDWHSIAGQHPQWLYGDGLHLRPDGAEAYAALIAAAAR